jgi:formylglycine-generating enzyme required for sulfatase activity
MHRNLLPLAFLPMLACYPDTREHEDSVAPADNDTDTDSDTDSDSDADTDTNPNTAPTAPTVHITPTAPTDLDALTCVIDTDSVDPEGDALTYSYAWSSDAGGTSAGEPLPADLTTTGETWTCSVTASDGSLSSPAGTASVVISASFLDYTTSHGGTMLAIPAGTFVMGSASGEAHEGPPHTVTLTHDFWIGQNEVTQAQYIAGMSTNPSNFLRCGDNCPVEQVSWKMAAMYANALSTAEGLESCYTPTGSDLEPSMSGDPYACEGYRLPTEAEWEYAARATDSYEYAGSNTATEVAWYVANSEAKTHEVASKNPNAWATYDMSGNVWEWTNDWYGAYSAESTVNPTGVAESDVRVVRGGALGNEEATTRVSYRSTGGPDRASSDFGFRLARSSH